MPDSSELAAQARKMDLLPAGQRREAIGMHRAHLQKLLDTATAALPPPAELLRVAEYECDWRGQTMLHPAILCAQLYGERLGEWQVAVEVMEGLLQIEAFNPYLRCEAYRLLGRARAALGQRAAACEAMTPGRWATSSSRAWTSRVATCRAMCALSWRAARTRVNSQGHPQCVCCNGCSECVCWSRQPAFLHVCHPTPH